MLLAHEQVVRVAAHREREHQHTLGRLAPAMATQIDFKSLLVTYAGGHSSSSVTQCLGGGTFTSIGATGCSVDMAYSLAPPLSGGAGGWRCSSTGPERMYWSSVEFDARIYQRRGVEEARRLLDEMPPVH